MTRTRIAIVVLALVLLSACGDGSSGKEHGFPLEPGAVVTTRVSVGTGDVQANGDSQTAAISADGNIVAFESNATNLTADAADCLPGCVFVHERETGVTTRLPVEGFAVLGPALSGDGRFVAVTVQRSGTSDYATVVVDRASGTNELIDVTPAGDPSVAPGGFLSFPAISADGRFVAFGSDAGDLVASDGNGVTDVFVRDRQSGTTERASVSSAGAEADATSGFFIGPAISSDGRFVAFKSAASNLVPDDRNAGVRCLDVGGCADVFVRDRQLGTTERVNLTSDGREANGSSAINIPLAMSADGRYVAFLSNATNLVPGDADRGVQWFEVYRRDRSTGTTVRVSVAADGGRADGPSFFPALSADGAFVSFSSSATNLLADATLDCGDFCSRTHVRDVARGTTSIANVTVAGTISTRSVSGTTGLSGDGRFVAFSDLANDLVHSDTNGRVDVFVRGTMH